MNAVDIGLVVALLAIVVALFLLAMVEASLLHVRRSAVVDLASRGGDPQSRRLLGLLDELPTVMNAVLLAVLFGQVTATGIAGVLAERWLGGTGITIATIAVTVVLFIYGEAIPKTMAIRDPVRYARRLSRSIRGLSRVLRPIVSVLAKVADWQAPGEGVDTVSAVSEGELLHLTDQAAAAGRIEASDAELIEKAFTLGDLSVAEIAMPIERVVSVAASTTVDAALRMAIASGHRRLPVYDGAPDRIIGFVRLRDLAGATSGRTASIAADQMLEALTVDGATLAIDVLREMQRTRRHLAVVTTGGAVVGMVTVEDIVEELLGAIDDADP